MTNKTWHSGTTPSPLQDERGWWSPRRGRDPCGVVLCGPLLTGPGAYRAEPGGWLSAGLLLRQGELCGPWASAHGAWSLLS